MAETITHEPDCLGYFAGARRDEYDPCRSWCFGCMRCEPTRDGDYRACGECGHVFRTEAELVGADLAVAQRVAELAGLGELVPRSAREIVVCPVCAHDF